METTQKKPIVINLGKSNRKRIKRLKRGEGTLMIDVQTTLVRLKMDGRIAPEIEPVVFVVERRRSKSSMAWLPIPKWL
jgi:hypothetical protein